MSASQTAARRTALVRRLAEELARRYPHWGSVRRVDPIAGGFSGADLFRASCDAGTFAVKLSSNRAGFAAETAARHWVLEAIRATSEQPIFPRLARDASGSTVWLLTAGAETLVVEARDWLEDSGSDATFALAMPDSGAGDGGSKVRIASAFELLARFHHAAGRVVLPESRATYLQPESPLPERYVHELRQVSRTNLAAIHAETDRLPLDLREPARQYLARLPAKAEEVIGSFERLSGIPAELRLCLRDAHRTNIACREGVAETFFDWDALRYDRRIGDFARLAASFGLSAVEAVDRAAEAIQGASPADELTSWESAALSPVLATQVWLPPLTWLKWMLVENRAFDDPVAALGRLRETLNLSILRPFAADET